MLCCRSKANFERGLTCYAGGLRDALANPSAQAKENTAPVGGIFVTRSLQSSTTSALSLATVVIDAATKALGRATVRDGLTDDCSAKFSTST